MKSLLKKVIDIANFTPTEPDVAIRRYRTDDINQTALVYHTIRTKFEKTGVTMPELRQYFKEHKVQITDGMLHMGLRTLSGSVKNHEHRDELYIRNWKKDFTLHSNGAKIPLTRYYYNDRGTVRVRPLESSSYAFEDVNTSSIHTKIKALTGVRIRFYRV